mgnify:FL=1
MPRRSSSDNMSCGTTASPPANGSARVQRHTRDAAASRKTPPCLPQAPLETTRGEARESTATAIPKVRARTAPPAPATGAAEGEEATRKALCGNAADVAPCRLIALHYGSTLGKDRRKRMRRRGCWDAGDTSPLHFSTRCADAIKLTSVFHATERELHLGTR